MPVLPSYRNQPIDLCANQLNGFYMRATLAFNGLNDLLTSLVGDYSSFAWSFVA